MTDKDKIQQIGERLEKLKLDNMSYPEYINKFEKMTIEEIRAFLWELYCFTDDVCEILNWD